jgi:hypothetical protein
MKASKSIVSIIGLTFFSVSMFFLMFSVNMGSSLDHDEHQFIASAKLLAKKMQLPYIDYIYLHMPNLVFVYALIFKFTNWNLMGARVFSAICASLILGLIFYVTWNIFRHHSFHIRFIIASSSVILLSTHPIFLYTSGQVWNHSLSILFSLLAFLFHCRMTYKAIFFSGMFLGLAIGTRLSFAPLTVPFVLILFCYRTAHVSRRFYLFLSFSMGVFISMIPSFLMFASAPDSFVFGYTTYSKLSIINQHMIQKDTSLLYKLVHLVKNVLPQPANAALVLLFIFFILLMSKNKLFKSPMRYFEVSFILMLIPFLLIGSLVPPRPHLQYFYAPTLFLVLGIYYGFGYFCDTSKKLKWGLTLLVCAVVICIIHAFPQYQRYFEKLSSFNKWIPMHVHNTGIEIANAVGQGKTVLTLSPIFPLEGGCEIYKEFVTGPFAWRIAPLLSKPERTKLRIISSSDLDDFLKIKPPDAIFVGYESKLDQPLIKYAKEKKYKRLKISKQGKLWLNQN